MSKIVYLLGAGASYGNQRDKEQPHRFDIKIVSNTGESISHRFCASIHRGLPIVSELPNRILYMYSWLCDGINKLKDNNPDKQTLKNLADDINWLHKESSRHTTIDTFAKKLYVTDQDDDYCRLKRVFTIYLMWEQINNNPDIRYDSFFAAILGDTYDDFPKEISIVSWNYDCQLELAYREYCRLDSISMISKKLGVIDKTFALKNGNAANFRIMKLNGCALIEDAHCILDPFFDTLHTPLDRIISIYKHSEGDKTLLSFAWEKMDEVYKAEISAQVNSAEIIVVIGYSFPFFNRNVDRFLFENMPNLKKIYIQDPYADRIEQTLSSVIPPHIYSNIKKEPITNTDQFYLPPEL